MNHDTRRYLGLFTTLFCVVTTTIVSGCTNEKQAPDEAPYGQAAPPAGAPATTGQPPAQAMANQPGGGPPPGAMGTGPFAGGPPPGGGPPGGFMGGPPPGGPPPGGAGLETPLTPTPELDKAIQDAGAKHDKKVLAAALASRGFARMNDDSAGARVKYRKALDDFREALKNDPTNAKAKDNKALIEGIYRSMGRPIPGEPGSPPGP